MVDVNHTNGPSLQIPSNVLQLPARFSEKFGSFLPCSVSCSSSANQLLLLWHCCFFAKGKQFINLLERVSSELLFRLVNLTKSIKMVNDEVTFLFLTQLFKGSHYKVGKSSSNLNLFNKISLTYYTNEIPQRRTKLQTHLFDLF